MYKIILTSFNPDKNIEPTVVRYGPIFKTEESAKLFMLYSVNDCLSELNTPGENSTPVRGVFIADLNGEHDAIIRLWEGQDYRIVMHFDIEEIQKPKQDVKVKVLNYIDCDNKNIMDSFVFTEEANLDEITKKVNDVFEAENGERPYCDIIEELYSHLMLNVIENKKYDW